MVTCPLFSQNYPVSVGRENYPAVLLHNGVAIGQVGKNTMGFPVLILHTVN